MALIKERIALVLNSKHPVKLLIAYALRKTKLSPLFYIQKSLYRLRFFPSALLMHLWADADAREGEVLFLSRLVKIGSNVVDVGANVGTLTLPLAVAVGRYGKVLSIEAHPTTFHYLNGNIAINSHIHNIHPYNLAMGEHQGEILFSSVSSDDMNKVIDNQNNHSITVPMRTLDSVIQESGISKIRLLKIDVEGYELFVLEGAEKTLSATEIVFFESWEKHFQSYGYSTKNIIDLLKRYDFTLYKIVDDILQPISSDYISVECENLLALKDPKDIDCIYEND